MKNIFIVPLASLILFSFTAFSQEDGFVKTKDGQIHYKTFGSGTPILIINGGPGMNCEGFSSLAKLLSDKYKAILFDQRGTGQSELNKTDSTTVTMDLMAEDIESLKKHLDIEKWVVLGHSFGGWMAEHYATKYPESIRGMILSGSGGINLGVLDYFGANREIRLSENEKDSLKYWNEKIKQGDTTHYAKYQWGKALAPSYLYNKEFVPQIAERLTQGNSQITALVFKDLFKIHFDCRESLKNFTKPVLIIQGRQDIIGDGTGYEAHMVLKNSSLIFINKCGHYGWLDQKEKYLAEIDKFMARTDF